jgi:hypothetical protein
VLVADGLLDLLPLNPERWVGQQIVEVLAAEAVLGEGVAEHDVRGVLAFQHHV